MLYAIPVMNIPVKYKNLFDTMNTLCIFGSNGGRVEETEAAGLVHFCVVTRRSNDGNALRNLETRSSVIRHCGCNARPQIRIGITGLRCVSFGAWTSKR